MKQLIISVCDYSGAWTRPYAEAGYTVLRIDPKHGGRRGNNDGIVANNPFDAPLGTAAVMSDGGYGVGLTAGEFLTFVKERGLAQVVATVTGMDLTKVRLIGMIMQPPCTHFSVSGAQYWPAKDSDGRTVQAVAIVRECLALKDELNPEWWVMENPVGRIQKLVPELGDYIMWFHPYFYGDPYTKRTHLFGKFNTNLPRSEVEPERVCSQGSWIQKLGGNSERTKELRSMTPPGFARAFFEVNP